MTLLFADMQHLILAFFHQMTITDCGRHQLSSSGPLFTVRIMFHIDTEDIHTDHCVLQFSVRYFGCMYM